MQPAIRDFADLCVRVGTRHWGWKRGMVEPTLKLSTVFAVIGGSALTPVHAATVALPAPTSAWPMFLAADPIVKGVILVLLVASIATWTLFLAKSVEFVRARTVLCRDLKLLRGSTHFEELRVTSPIANDLLQIARSEFASAIDVRNPASAESMKERLGVRLNDGVQAAAQRALSGINVLASIGATAPFVGLFGTVWGIMNSFIGISRAQTTNLAVVAPGIAEALLATAMGLVAAIPAVLIYNAFTRSATGYRRLLAETSTDVACLVSRQVERAQVTGAA